MDLPDSFKRFTVSVITSTQYQHCLDGRTE